MKYLLILVFGFRGRVCEKVVFTGLVLNAGHC